MIDVDALRHRIDEALTAAMEELDARLIDYGASLTPVAESMRAFVAGGKRIRPLLLQLGFRAAGAEDETQVMGPALALELLHTCALVHDDVIDKAETRRGRPSLHSDFAAAHRRMSWRGDPEAYGEAVAILVGDLALVYSDDLFLRARVDTDRLVAGFKHFTQLREEVMAGQYLDLHHATSGAGSRSDALTVATLKSGRYSVSRPLEVGAVLASADDTFIDGLRAFGDPLGRAFQVRDDLLGLFGDEATTGKSTSSDLREGKRTLIIAEALARLDDESRTALERGLGKPDLSDTTADELKALLRASGAKAAAESYVRESVTEANLALSRLAIDEPVRQALSGFVDLLSYRTA
ncbi:MAG: polyprenyl synthetase family protein [Nitriliruptoraceae bacterium]